MFENVSGMKIKGKYFTDEQKLIFFPNEKDRISMVFGRNGSGKSTITDGFCACCKTTPELIAGLIDASKLDLIFAPEQLKSKMFVFDEKYIDNDIKLSNEGLHTIILFGEQVEVDAEIKELEKKLENNKPKLNQLRVEISKYSDEKNAVSPIFHLEKIKNKLKEDNGWADHERDLKGNKTKSPVSDAVALEICQMTSSLTIAELEEEYNKIKEMLAKTADDTISFPNSIEQVSFDKSFDDTILLLLTKTISKPELTEREKLILKTIENGLQSQVESARNTFSNPDTKYCPYCYREIDDVYTATLVKSINSVLNKEANNHREELINLKYPSITFDSEKYKLLDENLSMKVAVKVTECKEIMEGYRKIATEKSENVYSPITQPNLHLVNAINELNFALKDLENMRLDFNNVAKRRKKNRDRLFELNKLIASKQQSGDYKTYIKQQKEQVSETEKFRLAEAADRQLTNKIDELNQKKNNVDIAIKSINKALEYVFFSAERLSIELKNDLYYLKSNGRYVKPKDVSCGERNIIALCYFFTQIMSNSDVKDLYKQELLLVIDDPISSFDFENKVGIMSYLNSQVKRVIEGNKNSKVIILTHDLSTMFDLEKAFNSICSKIKDLPNFKTSATYCELFNKELKKFEFSKRHEYSELLRLVFEYAQTGSSENRLEIGNAMRRVMEAYSTFNYRKGITVFSEDKELLLQLGNKSCYFENLMYRIVLNGESHFAEHIQSLSDQTNFFNFLSDTEKQRTAKDVLCLIYTLNPKHIRAHLKGISNAENTLKAWHANIPENTDLSTTVATT